ncbi:MAG: hypothetical protein WCO09_04265, partial [bacterium]
MFKKIISSVFVLVAIFSINSTTFAQEASLYIPIVQTDKPSYTMGETVKGNFRIDNNAETRQSDILIKISTSIKKGEDSILVDEKKQDTLYLEADSKRTIPFTYQLPKDIAGRADITVTAFMGDGTMLGQKSAPILIKGVSKRELVSLTNAYISYAKEGFDLQEGPTMPAKSDASLVYSIGTSSKIYQATPVLTLYNRTNNGTPISTTSQKAIIVKSGSTYTIKLPTDLSPLVYAGTLSFESEDVQISPIYFRYIIKGPIGTILNANTDVLGGEKNSVINVKVSYAGTPIAFNDPKATSTPATSTIFATLYDKDGKILGTNQTDINLTEVGDAIIPITLSEKADKVYISAVMKKDGTTLSEYKVSLPSEKELEGMYKLGSGYLKLILNIIGLILLVASLIVIFIYKDKREKRLLVSFIILIILSVGLITYSNVWAATKSPYKVFTSIFAPSSNFIVTKASSLRISSIYSPGPSSSVSYAPGEKFKLNVSASYVACSNSLFEFSVFGPSSTWYNNKPADYLKLVPKMEVVGTRGKLGVEALINNWKGAGGIVMFQRGNGLKNWRDNGSWTLVGKSGDPYISISYNKIGGSYEYTMPTTPGLYDFVFLYSNDAAGGNVRVPAIVSQQVCVTGAGLCYGEEQPTQACLNLPSTYTMGVDGKIYDPTGKVTNLVKDEDGNCEAPVVPNCDEDPTAVGCDDT